MCVSPLFGIRYYQINPDTGKNLFKIQKYSNVESVIDLTPRKELGEKERLLIPCGKCIECRLAYSRMWADRIMLEAKESDNNYMITLTYDNDNLPINTFVDKEGTVVHSETLLDDEISNFMKNLRRYYKYHYDHENIRFYGAGEYGDLSGRPHYHIVLFNLPIDDLALLFRKDGYQVYTSDTLEKIWKKGIVSVEALCWDNAAYVARYVVKKQKGPNAKSYYEERGIIPEYVRMSRKPGIAENYFKEHKDEIYKYDSIVIKKGDGSSQLKKPPRYFDTKYEEIDFERLQQLKKQRIEAVVRGQEDLESKTDIKWREWLKDNERRVKKRTQDFLRRNLSDLD